MNRLRHLTGRKTEERKKVLEVFSEVDWCAVGVCNGGCLSKGKLLRLIDEILAEKRRSKVAALEISNREEGHKIIRYMVNRAVKGAWKRVKI